METFRDYRIRWWIERSFMAMGTGCVLGYLASPFLAFLVPPPHGGAVVGLVAGFVIFQVSALRQLRSGPRGATEYAHREAQIDDAIDGLRFSPGNITCDPMELDFAGTEVFLDILKDNRPRSNEETFLIYMGGARQATKLAQDEKAVDLLQQAVQLKPRHLVANFRLAEAFERIGPAKEAVEAYRSALIDPGIQSQTLTAFVTAQIDRVNTHGPNRRSQYYGLKRTETV